MILLSNGGNDTFRSAGASDLLAIGTVDGVSMLHRENGRWQVAYTTLRGCFVSALSRSPSGTLFAATHGVGVARSCDDGRTWEWRNRDLGHHDLWSSKTGLLNGREVVGLGALPANVYLSYDDGDTWDLLPALREAPSAPDWTFPPPPHVGHVKDVVFDGDRMMVGIEIGGLLISTDGGASFSEMPVEPEIIERDIHRILLHPERPNRIVAANGIVGVTTSEDRGATWRRNPVLANAEYPDAFVINPNDPDEFFLAAGNGWPTHWYARGRAQGRIVRSRDAGQTWKRLLGGLPDGQRALFSALSIEAHDGGIGLYSVDTDGQVFESLDGGDRWTIIADVAPVSKGEFHRALVKDRQRLANIDEMQLGASASARVADKGK